MFRKSKIHLVTTFAIAASFGAIDSSVNLVMAANAEDSRRGQIGIDFVESYTPPHTEKQYDSPIKPYDAAASVRPQAITLAAMSTQELDKKKLAHKPGGPVSFSVQREVPDTDTVAKTAGRTAWTTTSQGNQVGSIRIKSTDAKGVFIGVLVKQLPPTATLRFHGDKSSTAYHVSATEILSLIQTNVNAGDKSDFARTYWAPNFDSDDVTMEIELPAGVSRDTVQISIPTISHVFTTLAELDKNSQSLAKTGAGTCKVDATCYPEYDNESRAVAKMFFIRLKPDGTTVGSSCTGTLLNNRFSDGTPYFLTANHCIDTQTEASTLRLDWLFRTSSCNSGVQSTPTYRTDGGAVLLYNNLETDTSFLKLNTPPPSAARFAAWSAELVNVGEPALGLHHPNKRLLETSLGPVKGYKNCRTTSADEGFGCNPAFVDAVEVSNHILANWTVGSIEGGSSGSGLFVTRDNSRYLVGVLHGGDECKAPFSATNLFYGRFDLAYRAALKTWLSPDVPNSGKLYAAMDLNGDAKSDLVVQSAAGNTEAWLMNGTAISSAVNLMNNDPSWTVSHRADFNGDGKADLLWRNTNGATAIWLMDGTVKLSQALLFGAGAGWSVTHTADFNSDGKADLLWRNASGAVAIWLMNGTVKISDGLLRNGGSAWSVTHTGDLNGDGKADLLWRDTNGAVAAWLMNGTTTTTTSDGWFQNPGSGWSITQTADLNGDGKDDLLWRNSNGAVATWLMNGTAKINEVLLQNAGSGWSVTHTADFNGDRKADLLWRYTNGAEAIWLMDGIVKISQTLLIASPGWDVTHTADFNGDGKADLLWRQSDGSISAWLMNGTLSDTTAMLTGLGSLRVTP
jgi:FG-GAP-like repeat/Trypsin